MIQDLFTQLHPIAQGVAAAFIFAATFFMYVRLDPDNPEKFDTVKFGTTVGIGAVIGGLFAAAGIAPNYENIAWTLTQYGGVIMFTEKGVKALWRGEQRLARESALGALKAAFGTTASLGRSREQLEEELNSGTAEYAAASDDERREEWDRRYPDPDTAAQLDDPVDSDENDGTGDDELPPA